MKDTIKFLDLDTGELVTMKVLADNVFLEVKRENAPVELWDAHVEFKYGGEPPNSY